MIEPLLVFGPYSMNRFGKPRGGDAEVRLGAVGPRVVDVHAVAADDVERAEELGGREPGGEDDRVDRSGAAVGGDDRVAR